VKRRKLAWAAAGVCVVLLAIEGIARLSGIASVPLYNVDSEIGYVPQPNQAGAFLRRNDWLFNERSMGAPPFAPEGRANILLLGDSIVFGGDAYRQRDKLGPSLQRAMQGNYAVWPVGAGHWGVLNEMTYLQRNADLLDQVQTLVWVLITVDFERRVQSWSPLIHPQKQPLLASVFGLRRFILPRLGLTIDPANLAPAEHVPLEGNVPPFEKFAASLKAAHPALHVLLVLYPSAQELDDPGLKPALTIGGDLRSFSAAMGFDFVQVAKDSRWRASYYRDPIHPTAEGDEILAEILKNRLDSARTGH
jgi:lysophospholipase L1-like esterase